MRSTVDITRCIDALSTTALRLAGFVRVLAFWTAILLPMGYLPLLLVGHPAVADVSTLGTLLTVNLLAIAVGHEHGRDTPG